MNFRSIIKHKEHFRLWLKLVLTSPNYFHVSLPIKLQYAFRGFSANEYVWFNLKENDYREYISNYKRTISRDINGEYKLILDDKILFEDVFSSHVRIAKSYAWISDGIVYGRNNFAVDNDNIVDFVKEIGKVFLKVEKGAGGKGIFLIRYEDDSLIVNGKTYTDDELKKLILKQKKAFICEYIQQSEFENNLYPNASNTIRIVCAKKKGEKEARIIGAVQRIGNDESRPVDNVSSGALAASIDLETGKLGSGIAGKTHNSGEVFVKNDIHPDSGAIIKGAVIPNWRDVKDEITILTNSFPYLNFVAWDVLLTDEGICIIEANASSGLMMFQTEHGVKNGIFGDIYRSYGIL